MQQQVTEETPCWMPFRSQSGGSEWSPAGPNTSQAPPESPGPAAGMSHLHRT